MKLFTVLKYFFFFQEFGATCGLPWKTACDMDSFYWIYIFLIIQNFEQLAHALKNRVCPEIFHCFEIFLSFRIFEVLTLALKTKVVMKCFAVFNILLTFRMFEQLLLALKNRVCLEFTVLNVFFILQNFEQLALALKNRVCPENFHSIEYSFYNQDFWATCACPEKQSVPWIHCIEYIFFIIQNFEQTCACPEKQNLPWKFSLYWNIFLSFRTVEQLDLALRTEFALNFSSRGDGRPPASGFTFVQGGLDTQIWQKFNLLIAFRRDCIGMGNSRPVTSLGHQGWPRVFLEGPKFFYLCPIVCYPFLYSPAPPMKLQVPQIEIWNTTG